MPQARLAVATLLLALGASFINSAHLHAQQSPAPTPAPILPPAKIAANNPLGLTVDHSTLSVKDIDKEEAFFKDTLGFKEISSGNFGPDVKFRSLAIAGKQYEFGNKVGVAVSSRGGWLVGAKSFTGNPYDGHTLDAQLKQVKRMVGDRVSEAHVDMGYRGHDYDGAVTVHVAKRRRGRTPPALWRWMKRRAAVEPGIGHLKNEHRLERNRLKGVAGNAINAILSAAAMNFHKLLAAFWRFFLRCLMNVCGGLQTIAASEARQNQLLCA